MRRPIVHFLIPEGPRRGTNPLYRPVFPRGVLQVARAAEAAGWDATVLDGYSAPHLLASYFQVLAQREAIDSEEMVLPDLAGISVHGPPAIEPALAIAARLREIEPSISLLFGGQFANADAEILLPLLPESSILFCGDGDAAIAGVMKEALEASGPARLVRQPGLHPWQSFPDLDLLLPRYADYFGEQDFEYHLETQIGCPYRCFHCGTGRKGLYAKTVNRPIEAIQEELDKIVVWAKKIGSPNPRLWITDETFGSDPEHSRAFCEALISRPEAWQWRAQSRADVVTEDLLEAMRMAGCRRLAFGVEIPNDAGLDLLGKHEAMKAVEQAFALCHDQGVSPEAIIVVGTPGDLTRPEEFLDALEMLKAESVQAYIYHPIPGSPWWKKYGAGLRENSGSLRRWSDLDFHSPPLDASPADEERAIVSFLALHLWIPESERRPSTSPAMRPQRTECNSCGRAVQSELVVAHPASEIQISRYRLDGRGYYVATTPKDAEVLEFPLAEHRNIYGAIVSIDRKDLDLAKCPRCLLHEESHTLNPTEEANVPRNPGTVATLQ